MMTNYSPTEVKFGKYVCDICGKSPIVLTIENKTFCEAHSKEAAEKANKEVQETNAQRGCDECGSFPSYGYSDGKVYCNRHAQIKYSLKDEINHPSHYNSHPSGVEAITICECYNFNIGNALKYLWRADHKHESPTKDLEKAKWYIERELQRLNKKNSK
jgi:hypothetical protein